MMEDCTPSTPLGKITNGITPPGIYLELLRALKETAFITHLMKELGFRGYERAQVPVFSDAMTCIAHLKRDGVAWLEGTRQYEVELSSATQRCRNGEVVPIKISGKDNPARSPVQIRHAERSHQDAFHKAHKWRQVKKPRLHSGYATSSDELFWN